MASIPTSLHDSMFCTMDETAARLDVTRPTVCRYILEGVLSGTKIGRTKLVRASSLIRLLELGTDVVRAELFHAANARAMNDRTTPELEAKEAVDVARHRAAIAKARLRLARERDLAGLQPNEVPVTNNLDDGLPEITDRTILKFASTAFGISNQPLSRWNDDQIRELLRFARMAEGRSLSMNNPNP